MHDLHYNASDLHASASCPFTTRRRVHAKRTVSVQSPKRWLHAVCLSHTKRKKHTKEGTGYFKRPTSQHTVISCKPLGRNQCRCLTRGGSAVYNHIVLEGRLQDTPCQTQAVNRAHAAAARSVGAARSSQPTVERTVTCIAPPGAPPDDQGPPTYQIAGALPSRGHSYAPSSSSLGQLPIGPCGGWRSTLGRCCRCRGRRWVPRSMPPRTR